MQDQMQDQTEHGTAETPASEVAMGGTPDAPQPRRFSGLAELNELPETWVEAYRSPDVHWDPLRALLGLEPGSMVILEVNPSTGELRVKLAAGI